MCASGFHRSESYEITQFRSVILLLLKRMNWIFICGALHFYSMKWQVIFLVVFPAD